MTSPYTPSPTKMAGTITEPVDGERRNAASVTVMTRKLANGIAYLNDYTPLSILGPFLISQDVAVPDGATHCYYEMWGQGGQGGGAYKAAGSGRSDSSGGGGGGAIKCCGVIEVDGVVSLTCNVGNASQTGGVGGTSNTNGTNGADSTIVRTSDVVTLATARGGGGGARGTRDNASADTATVLATDEDGSASPVYRVSEGGSPVHGTVAAQYRTFNKPISIGGLQPPNPIPQAGGNGNSRTISGAAGGASPQGFGGGLGGNFGTADSTYLGGSGGGGGRAGPAGNGGSGGTGGNGNSAGSGATGVTNGSDAPGGNGTGAGGGGGGCAGGSSTLTGNGGGGGLGSSGCIKTLIFMRIAIP